MSLIGRSHVHFEKKRDADHKPRELLIKCGPQDVISLDSNGPLAELEWPTGTVDSLPCAGISSAAGSNFGNTI